MSLIRMWGTRHGIPSVALVELESLLGVAGRAALADPSAAGEPGSESRQQSLIRLEAARRDILLWRNNVGAAKTETGFIRYGLANESDKMNDKIKSSDLIGIERVLITPAHVGSHFGVFTALECKKQGWAYRPNDAHATAQLTFINLVNSYGGRAKFITSPEEL